MRNRAAAAVFAMLIPVGIHSTEISGQGIELQARSVPRGELPIGFPEEILDAGFAIIEVTVVNREESPVQVGPEMVQAWSRGNKRLAQVTSTKILPKLLKFYRGSGPRGGEVYAGGPATGRPAASGGNEDSDADTYSALLTQQFKLVLDGYRLNPGPLDAGESIQGYIYVKSKHRGRKLAGGKVTLNDASAVIE